jgi:hypothetical protein
MAIIVKEDTDEKFELELNKGHLKALNEIVTIWDFKDKTKALEFALAVLKVTNPGTLKKSISEYRTQWLLPTSSIINGKYDGLEPN